MAQIAIRGIRIKELTIKPQEDAQTEKVTCTYQLISTGDKVLADQSVGGYNGMKIPFSAPTHKAFDEFLKSYRNDINLCLGLDAEQ